MYSCRQTYSALLLSDPLWKTHLIQFETQHVWNHSLTSCSVGLKMHHRSVYKFINDMNHFLLLASLALLPIAMHMHEFTLLGLQYYMAACRQSRCHHAYGYLCLCKPQACTISRPLELSLKHSREQDWPATSHD
jgi:hypothetical protein